MTKEFKGVFKRKGDKGRKQQIPGSQKADLNVQNTFEIYFSNE